MKRRAVALGAGMLELVLELALGSGSGSAESLEAECMENRAECMAFL